MKRMNENIDLTGQERIFIGFSWNQYNKQYSAGAISGLLTKSNTEIDCDASAYLVQSREGCLTVSECIDYDNMKSMQEAVVHQGDNKTGGSGGDDEMIEIDFRKLSPDISEILFTLDLLKEKKKQLKIGKLSQISVKLYDKDRSLISRYDFAGIGEKVVQVGMLRRTEASWIFVSEVRNLADVKTHSDVKDMLICEN